MTGQVAAATGLLARPAEASWGRDSRRFTASPEESGKHRHARAARLVVTMPKNARRRRAEQRQR